MRVQDPQQFVSRPNTNSIPMHYHGTFKHSLHGQMNHVYSLCRRLF